MITDQQLKIAAKTYSEGWGDDNDEKAFIAGANWMAQVQSTNQGEQEDIKRLKGLIKTLWEHTFYAIPIPDNIDGDVYEKAFNNAWQKFQSENNL